MKTKFTVMASAILMGTAFTVNAYGANPPAPPAPYGSGPLTSPHLAPNLFKSEKSAFAGLEGAMQEAEAVIYQGGCAAAAGKSGKTWDISASVDQSGTGSIEVSSNGVLQFFLDVKERLPAPTPAYLGGTVFTIKGNSSNVFNGSKLPAYDGFAYYSKTGQMMTLGASFQVGNVNNNYDYLKGGVIKDFYKLNNPATAAQSKCGSCGGGGETPTGPIPIIYDWGLQYVSKNYVPQDKWWQRSWANRSDNSDGTTVFVKDRLFSAKGDGVCKIRIDMIGNNDASSFEQEGTLTISKVAP